MSKIYIGRADFEDVDSLKKASYYDRGTRFKDLPFSTVNEYLELPANALVIDCLAALKLDLAHSGIIFENAKGLPECFKDSMLYWCDHENKEEALVYYQNSRHQYMIDIESAARTGVVEDKLITESYVVEVVDLPTDLSIYNQDAFIKLSINFDIRALCGTNGVTDNEDCEAVPLLTEESDPKVYASSNNEGLTIYLKVSDIVEFNRPRIFLDLIRYEMLDYGYYY